MNNLAELPATRARVPGLVSVNLVVYNGRKDVGAAIDSVLAQTYRPLELVVVDDGSTDGTWELLQSYGDRIVAVRQPNGGLPVARNTALRHSRGEFIALMDHDDLCMPERIAVQVAFLQRNPEIGLVCSDFSAFNELGPIEASHIATYYSQCSPENGGVAGRYPEAGTMDIGSLLPDGGGQSVLVPIYKGDAYEQLAFGNFVHPPTVMCRAAVIDQAGEFDVSVRAACDWDWIVRMSRVAGVGHVHRALLDYRRSPSQMSGLKFRPTGHWMAWVAAKRIVDRDSTLAQRHPRRVRSMLGEFALDAAYANALVEPRKAWQLLWLATAKYRFITDATWRTLFKLLLPNRLVRALTAQV